MSTEIEATCPHLATKGKLFEINMATWSKVSTSLLHYVNKSELNTMRRYRPNDEDLEGVRNGHELCPEYSFEERTADLTHIESLL